MHADGGEASLERGFDHVAGETRVLADDDAVRMVAAQEDHAGRLCDAHREVGRDDDVGEPSDPVRSEMLATHPRRLP